MVTESQVLEAHRRSGGKIEILGKVRISSSEDLSTYYTPGVAYVSTAVAKDREKAYEYTSKANTIAIINDGTRVLGLGNIGPEGGLPVMEGKALLFKKYGGVDAIPLCIGVTDKQAIIEFARAVAPTFGGIVIEDIESPKSLEIVDELSRLLDIPVFHDDQQGLACIVLAGLINSFRLAGKDIKKSRIAVMGCGSAGIGVARILHKIGVKNLYVSDSAGLIFGGRGNLSKEKLEIASFSNPDMLCGGFELAANGADAIIGLSTSGRFSRELIGSMAEKPIVFALTNPNPEISYSEAKAAGAFIVATGRSDDPNQINNLMAFPGIMRGLLDTRAREVNYDILHDVAKAIAKLAGKRISQERIVPGIINYKESAAAMSAVAEATAKAAISSGVARLKPDPKEVRKHTKMLLKRYRMIEKRAIPQGR